MTNCCSNSLCILLSNGISLPVLQVCVFFSAPAYVFGRIFFSFVCVCESQSSCCCCFQRKWDFVRAKKAQQQSHCFAHVKSVFTLIWRGCSIIHSLILSVSLSLYSTPLLRLLALNRWGWAIYNQINLQAKKKAHKKRQTHGEIFDKVMRQNIGPSMYIVHVCAYVFYAPSFWQIESNPKRILIWAYIGVATEIKVYVKYTHTTRTKERRWPKKKSSRIEN